MRRVLKRNQKVDPLVSLSEEMEDLRQQWLREAKARMSREEEIKRLESVVKSQDVELKSRQRIIDDQDKQIEYLKKTRVAEYRQMKVSFYEDLMNDLQKELDTAREEYEKTKKSANVTHIGTDLSDGNDTSITTRWVVSDGKWTMSNGPKVSVFDSDEDDIPF